MYKALAVALSVALTGCATTSKETTNVTSPTQIETFYQYQLFNSQNLPVTLPTLPEDVLTADVVLVGEWHTHSGIHRFQTDLLNKLSQGSPQWALSMEQFTRDNQTLVNEYLAGDIGEQVLINQGAGWPNYESDYRPLIELAKARELDVIAANAPKMITRCIGRQGIGYVEKLDDEQRSFIARDIDVSDSPYKEKFMASMHHGKPEQKENQYAAQITWDETMADSIVRYLAQYPDKKVMHVAGKFHTEQGLGTKAAILKRNPNLNVVVITPTAELDSNIGSDLRLLVLEPPARYIKMENRMKAYHSMKPTKNRSECLQ